MLLVIFIKNSADYPGMTFHLDKDDMEDKTAFDDMENVIVLQDVDGPLHSLK